MFDSVSFVESEGSGLPKRIARRMELVGEVQGVGMRPAIVQLALRNKVDGWVRNVAKYVELWIEGEVANVECFLTNLKGPGALPGKVLVSDALCVAVENYREFRILSSEGIGQERCGDVPLDRVTCKECQDEYISLSNPRGGYALIGCSSCGPRFSILKSMPFDRKSTAYAEFACCESCKQEYQRTNDRRYHSQTIACERCGPQVRGLQDAADALRQEEVIALRGLGGYQWLALAESGVAIEHLRQLKRRPRKPLAVMLSSSQVTDWISDPHIVERLCQPDGSIVIVPHQVLNTHVSQWLAEGVRAEAKSLGVLLPTTMLHAELIERTGPLVVTSANVEGEPMCIDSSTLGHQSDVWSGRTRCVVEHNRAIVQRVDDSVVMQIGSTFSTVRPARGLAPRSWDLGKVGLSLTRSGKPNPVVALGAQQKVCLAWSDGERVTLGPYIGDLTSVSMQAAAMEQWEHLRDLYRLSPKTIVHDFHPDYFSTNWALEMERELAVRRLAVHHHHAHWMASLLEPGWLDRRVIGFVWDGTGLGTDGSIWGGECFVGDRFHQERVANLLPFALPGGEAAIREPWRIAVSLLYQIDPTFCYPFCENLPVRGVQRMLAEQVNVVACSSMGRLFDGVAALILDSAIRLKTVSYEGEFAQLLEEQCDERDLESYELPIVPVRREGLGVSYVWDWRSMLLRIVREKLAGVPTGKIAMRFHRAIAHALLCMSDRFSDLAVTLSGGCFQNRVLIQLLQAAALKRDRTFAWPGLIPVNDSAIAIGQVLCALSRDDGLSQKNGVERDQNQCV